MHRRFRFPFRLASATPHFEASPHLDLAHPESVTENKYRVMYIDERGMLQLQLISYNIHDVFIKS